MGCCHSTKSHEVSERAVPTEHDLPTYEAEVSAHATRPSQVDLSDHSVPTEERESDLSRSRQHVSRLCTLPETILMRGESSGTIHTHNLWKSELQVTSTKMTHLEVSDVLCMPSEETNCEARREVERTPEDCGLANSLDVTSIAHRKSCTRELASFDDLPIDSMYHRLQLAKIALEEAEAREARRKEAEQLEREMNEYKNVFSSWSVSDTFIVTCQAQLHDVAVVALMTAASYRIRFHTGRTCVEIARK